VDGRGCAGASAGEAAEGLGQLRGLDDVDIGVDEE
jgi:hypothetical protein